jgi:hypothetical protein
MQKIHASNYRVPPGKNIDLGKWPTKVKPVYDSKEEYRSMLATHIEKLSERQSLLYASDKYALLAIFHIVVVMMMGLLEYENFNVFIML